MGKLLNGNGWSITNFIDYINSISKDEHQANVTYLALISATGDDKNLNEMTF